MLVEASALPNGAEAPCMANKSKRCHLEEDCAPDDAPMLPSTAPKVGVLGLTRESALICY